jgi:hypothetical protein
MIIDLPNVGPVRFSDDLTPDQLNAQIDAIGKKLGVAFPEAELGYGEMAKKSLVRGGKQISTAFGDIIPAMAANAIGADEYAKGQMEEAAATQREISKYYAPQYKELESVKGIGDVPGFALETFLENVPNILVSLIPGIGAEALAARTAAAGIMKQAGIEGAKKGLTGEALNAFALSRVESAAPQILAKRQTAQNAGIFLGSYAQNAPEVFQNIFESTGKMDTGAAMLWGSASAALDSVLPSQLARSITGPVKIGIVEKILEGSGMDKSLVRSITANVLKSAGFEGVTEGAQEAISISAEKFVANNPQVFESKDWKRIVESSVRGAVAGGPFGAVGGAAEYYKSRPEFKSFEDKAKETGKPQKLPEVKETQGQGTFYVYPDGRVATSEAAAEAEDKAQVNRVRDSQKRLKSFLKAKQGDLDLTQAPTSLEAEGEPNLFNQPASTAVAEPTKVAKPEVATVSSLGTVIGKDKNSLKSFGKAFGIGPTAAILRENGPLAGKDLSNPADAAEVRRILEAYASAKPASGASAKIEEYLKRPEFAVQPEETQDGIRSGLIPGASEPSVPSTGEALPNQEPTGGVSQPIDQGMGVSGQPAELTPSGERIVEPTLGVKETQDVAKAEAAVDPAVEAQKAFVDENDARTLEFMKRDLPEDTDVTGFEDTPAFKYLRLPSLLQEYFRLGEVIAQGAEPKQVKKNQAERVAIKEAIAKSDPNAAKLLANLEASPQSIPGLLENLNKSGRDLLAGEVRTRAEKAAQAKEQAAVDAKEDAENAQAAEMADKFVATNIAKAIASGKVDNLIDVAIESETNPEVKAILEKVKRMGLKTKVKSGKVTRKDGTLGAQNEVGVYDPATDTITLDPDGGLTAQTSIHELVHAAISHVLRNPNHPLTKQLTAIYDGVYNQLGSSYGAQDIQEFASELVGNPEFRDALKGIKAPKGGNMLQRIIQNIAEFFGFRKGTSAYEAGIKAINDILDVAGTEPKSAGDQMYNVINSARNAMPALTKDAIESTKNTFSNLQGMDYKALGLSVMRLDHINKIWGKQLPSIQTLIDNLEKRKGYIEASIKRIKKNYDQFINLSKTERAAWNRMQEMAYEARLDSAGRVDGAFKTSLIPPNASLKQIAEIRQADVKRKEAYDKARAIYNGLPSSVQKAYTTILNEYKESFDAYKDILLNSTDQLSVKQKIKAKFEAIEHIDGYIPFLRRGDYWVRYIDPKTGEEAASAFESVRERQQFIDTVLKGVEHTTYQNLQSVRFDPRSMPSGSFISEVIKGMDGASQEQIDNVYQAYLALFPAESISKQFMHSKNIRGMEVDITRGYADTMLKWSRKLGDSMYAPDIDRAVEGVRLEAKEGNDPTLTAVYRNIDSQKEFFHNPTFSKFVHGATALSYFEYISGNMSSALVNITALPMLVWPILGGRFGFGKTTDAMLSSHKFAKDWVLKGNNTYSKYNSLYQFLQDHGQLEHTMARELLEGRRQSTQDYTGLKAKVLDGLSIPFSATEKYNRAVTAIAAYDLAKTNGYSEEKALRLALDTVKDVHTSGMAETAPKWMQHPIGRMFFTFKSFAWNSAFIIARAFEQSFKGETKAIRDAARRQLLGTYFMASLFGGAKGLPFMGLAQTIGQMLHALFGDDEPYDFNSDMRAFFGELMYKGPVNWVTNLEISNRVGIAQDLVWRDDPRASSGLVLGTMQRMFGPAGSYLINVERAYDMFNQGHTERAIEAVLPSFARNGMKGTRYLVEGATTLKGDPIEEDIGAYNSLMQVIGFSPASLSSKYEVTSAAKTYEKKVADQRQNILNKYEMGRVGGDSDLLDEAREDIAKFNETHPKNRITGSTLQKSQAARKAAEKNMIYGVTFNKKLLPEIKEKFLEED